MGTVFDTDLDDCIFLCNRLLSLQDQDDSQITHCLRGEQLENYRNMLRIEHEKLEQFKNSLQELSDAQQLYSLQ